MRKKIFSLFTVFALCLTLVPTAALADETESRYNIQTGAAAIKGWSNTNGYDYIYLGKWNNNPVKWRVLSDNGDTATNYNSVAGNTSNKTNAMFLLSEDVLANTAFGGSSTTKWKGSTAEQWCNTFKSDALTEAEQLAVFTTNSKKESSQTINNIIYSSNSPSNLLPSAGSTVFFLSATEANNTAYGFSSNEARKAKGGNWWLLSRATKSNGTFGTIGSDGAFGSTAVSGLAGARPALNLDKRQVLFTAAANNSSHKTGLTKSEAYSGHEFKLTLKDKNSFAEGAKIVGGRTTLNKAYQDATLTIQHKPLSELSADYTNVTAALTDSDGNLAYYGSVNTDKDSTSTTVTLPNGLANGKYTLSLYGEDWNGQYESDFATGTPFETTITIHDGADGPDLSPRVQEGLMQINDITGYNADLGYNYLYFGDYNKVPIKWRVLSVKGNAVGENDTLTKGEAKVENDSAMFLLSESLLGTGQNGDLQYYNTTGKNDYIGSLAQAWCRNLTAKDGAFTAQELAAMLNTTKSDAQYAGKNWRNKVYKETENILNNDKAFFISAEEAANESYGFSDETKLVAYYNNKATRWWLRSAITDSSNSAGAVTYSGTYGWELCPDLVTEHMPARPAFNLSKDDVLFVSAAKGMKTNTASSKLSEIKSNTTSEWKLTLRDDSRKFAITETEAKKFSGGTLALNYSGATTGENEYISAILYDADGKAAFYGNLKALRDENDAKGSVELTVPTGMAEGKYTLKLFNEQYNGDFQTDYASGFCTVELTVDNTKPTLSDFDVTRAGETTASVSFNASEQGAYYYVVSDSETKPSIDTTGVGTAMTEGAQTLELTEMSADKSYLHILAKDVAGNVCDVQTVTILGYLHSPESADWDNTTPGKATWNKVDNANGYSVQLYKDGVPLGSSVKIDVPDKTEYTFTIPEPPEDDNDEGTNDSSDSGSNADSTTSSDPNPLPDNAIKEAGTYSFRVTALGDGTRYSNSIATESTHHLSSITVEDNENGTATASARYAVTGTEITLTGEPNSGYRFSGWEITPEVTITDNKFIMPDEAVTVKASFARRSGSGISTSYTITINDSENGSVTSSHKSARKGTTVTITVVPDKGFVTETLTVLDKNGNEIKLTDKGEGEYTFTMPAGKVEVNATFMDDNTMLNYFVDVKADDYYYDAVLWAAQKGITVGTDTVHFSPNASCTRAQIVTFLWRSAGSPVVNYAMNFSDVPIDAYYAEAVRWAVSEGITTGTSSTTFSPDDPCTRAQAVTFLFRSQKAAVKGGMAVREFADFNSIPAYAVDAIQWALDNKVTNGTGNGNFSPNATCTRAQIVAFLYRIYNAKA